MQEQHESTPGEDKASRRVFLQLLGIGGASLSLAGCDPATDTLARLLDKTDADFRPPETGEIDAVSHVINRITWGPRPGDYRRVRDVGVDAFIEEQLHPESLADRRCRWKLGGIESMAEPAAEMYEYDSARLLLDLTRHKLVRTVYSRRQLLEVMVDFWTDHFNIVSEKGDCKWLKAVDDRDVIRAHALGDFRTLVRASATSPAMLIYLDGHDNRVERPEDRPNENYARELLELHTLGVDGGYTQDDVVGVARCLSGWTYTNAPARFKAVHVAFDPKRHDDGAKTVLGRTIPAGGGEADLDRVLDVVCTHPSTARHVATKLCRRFIADPAPPAAVETVADAFLQSSGDIRVVLRTLFASEEFRRSRGRLFKRPLRFVVSALRGTAAATDCGRPVIGYLERMGHAPFQYPTPDGYPMEPAPWLGTLLWRWNFSLALAGHRLDGTDVNQEKLLGELGDARGVAAHLLGRQPAALELEILQGTSSPIALLLASPAFQRY